ncbi:MAG TPA: RNA methyltransferase [Pyrinomonadaceae bacterium]|nr:RNA methyltransferase [Pyrinomonadaceae bacterium]
MSRGARGGASREVITSRQNALVKGAREVRDGRDRAHIFVEGLRLCEEGARAALSIESAFFTGSLSDAERGSQLLDTLQEAGARLHEVSDGVMESMSDTKTPQGVVLIARRPPSDLAWFERRLAREVSGAPLVVVLHGAGNPSNAGAMLRVAEAAGAHAVVATLHTADLFSPKSLRGSMGSAFRLPLWAGAEFADVLAWCAAKKIVTVGTSASAALTHAEYEWTGPTAVVVGSEGAGLSSSEVEATGAAVRIPMRAPVESLNVAAALAVILYEAARQRGFQLADKP